MRMIGDRRGFVLLMGPVDHQQSEKVGPSGFEVGLRCLVEPDLMLVALVVWRAAQFGRRPVEDESDFGGVAAEDGEFFVEIGRTALKARSCLTAASELFNVCFKRDSRSSVAWFMG